MQGDSKEAPLNGIPRHKKIVSLIPLLVMVVLAEVTCRILPGHEDAGQTRSASVEPDSDLIWRLKPIEAGPLRTNELGFRDTPFNRDADRKVLLLGDSVAWGDGVRDLHQVFPQRLEWLMNERSSETHEVINSAVPGYSTFQQLRYLELRGLALKPDLTVLQSCLNDVVERYSSLSQFGGDNVFLGIDTRDAIPGLFGWLLRNSRAFESIARLARNIARDYQECDVSNMVDKELSPELKAAWSLTLTEIGAIGDVALKEDIPLVIVIAPYRFQLWSPDGLNSPQRTLREFAGKNGIPVIDLLPSFASFSKQYPDSELFNDVNHFSVLGHELAAQLLAEPLLTMIPEN